MHATFTKDLGTHAIGAQVHTVAVRAMAGAGGAVKLGQQLGGAFAAEAEQILTPEPRSLPVMAVALLLAAVSLRVRSRRRC